MKLGFVFLLFLSISILPTFAQYGSYNQQMPAPSQIQGMANQVNQTLQQVTQGKGIIDTILFYIQQFVNSIIGTANINGNQNPMNLTSSKLQGVSNAGFKVGQDLTNATFDLNSFLYILINSFSPFKIPFWLILLLSSIGTIIILVKIGKIIFKKGLLMIGIILLVILVLVVWGIRNSVVT